MASFQIILTNFALVCLLEHGSSAPLSQSSRLFRHLSGVLSNYSNVTLPSRSSLNEPIIVNIQIQVIQILEVDLKKQQLVVSCWPTQEWKDEYVVWNQTEFSEIPQMQLPPYLVWRPDIMVINTIDGQFEVGFFANVITASNGDMLWAPPAFYSVYCSMDATFFPYDQQSCDIKFTSLAYSSARLRLVPKSGHADFSDDYSRSSEWDVISSSQKTSSDYGEFDRNERHDIMTMRLNIKRKPLFYSVNLVIPITLVFGISTLTYFIPCHCHEKIVLGTTVLLALIMLQLMVSEIIPVTSKNLPLLAFYLLFAQIMVFVSLLFSVISMSLFYRGPKTIQIPSGLKRKMFFVWPKYLWLDFYPSHFTMDINSALHGMVSIITEFNSHVVNEFRPSVDFSHAANGQEEHELVVPSSISGRTRSFTEHPNESLIDTGLSSNGAFYTNHQHQPHLISADDFATALAGIECVNYISSRTKRDVLRQSMELEWKFVALIVDRVLFLIYVATVIGTLSSVLVWKMATTTTPVDNKTMFEKF